MYTSDNFERFILKLISKIRKICSKKYHFLSDDAVMSLVEGIPIFKTISLLIICIDIDIVPSLLNSSHIFPNLSQVYNSCDRD